MKGSHLKFSALTALVLLAQLGCNQKSDKDMLADTDQSTFKPGQIWSYKTRPGEEASTLTILKVEKSEKLGIIVHVAIDGLKMKNQHASDGVGRNISHLPFAENAVRSSVSTKNKESAPLPDFMDGYNEWRTAHDQGKGGEFTASVADVVQSLEKSLNQ